MMALSEAQLLSVIGANDRLEALLASSVPDHSFDDGRTHGKDFGAKLNAQSGLVVFGELVVEKAKQERTLACV